MWRVCTGTLVHHERLVKLCWKGKAWAGLAVHHEVGLVPEGRHERRRRRQHQQERHLVDVDSLLLRRRRNVWPGRCCSPRQRMNTIQPKKRGLIMNGVSSSHISPRIPQTDCDVWGVETPFRDVAMRRMMWRATSAGPYRGDGVHERRCRVIPNHVAQEKCRDVHRDQHPGLARAQAVAAVDQGGGDDTGHAALQGLPTVPFPA